MVRRTTITALEEMLDEEIKEMMRNIVKDREDNEIVREKDGTHKINLAEWFKRIFYTCKTMITSLHLRNWRSHKDTEIRFSKGTNLIIGRMGAGKSSILNAICYALFGTFPDIKGRKLALRDVIREGESFAEVILTLSLNEDVYQITRRIENGTRKKAEIRKNGLLMEVKAKNIAEIVKKVLGFDYEVFTRALYVVQNDVNHFIECNPSERKVELDRILGIDKFEKIRQNCQALRNRIKKMRALLQQQVDEKEIEKKKDEINKYIEEAKEKEEELEKQEKELRIAYQEAKELWEKLKKMRNELKKRNALKNEIASLKGKLDGIKKNLSFKTIEEINEIMEKKKQEVEMINEKVMEKKRLILEIKEKIKDLQRTIAKIRERREQSKRIEEKIKITNEKLQDLLQNKKLEEIENRLKENEKEIKEIDNNIAKAKAEIKEAKKQVEHLTHAYGSCPVCNHPLSNEMKEKLIKEKENAIEQIKNEIGKQEKKRIMIEKETEKLKYIIEKARELNAQINMLISQRVKPPDEKEERRVENEIIEKEAMLEKGEEIIKTLEKEKWKKMKDVDEMEKQKKLFIEMENMMFVIKEKENMLTNIEIDEKEIERIENAFEIKNEIYSKKKAKVAELRKEVEGKKEKIAILEREVKREEGIMKKTKRYLKAEEDLAKFYNALIQVQEQVRQEMVEALNQAMQEIWSVLYPYDEFKRVRLFVNEKDYRFQLWKEGRWWNVERASGGEKACLSLAFRVALASIFTERLTCLILDEPTHNLDKDAVKALSDALQEKLPSIVQQTLVISHDENLIGGNLSGEVYMIKKDSGGCSVVEKYS